MNNAAYSGNGIQSSYNYLPLDFNMPPSLLFRSAPHELPDSTGSYNFSVPLDFSSNPSINNSLESINEETIVSAHSSPEYGSNADYRSGYLLPEEDPWTPMTAGVGVNSLGRLNTATPQTPVDDPIKSKEFLVPKFGKKFQKTKDKSDMIGIYILVYT